MKHKTPDEVARKYGLTYDPVRVSFEKKKVRFNGNKLEEVVEGNNRIIWYNIVSFSVAFGVAIIFVVSILNACS